MENHTSRSASKLSDAVVKAAQRRDEKLNLIALHTVAAMREFEAECTALMDEHESVRVLQ